MAAAPVAFDFEPAPPTQVEPTTRDRVHVYDLIRGVAVLGILLANIPWFAGPEFANYLSMKPHEPGVDATVAGWTAGLVTGKFRSMLAILFGIGIWMQYEKRSKIAGNWPGGYLKRMLLLGVFGLAHGLLIWQGDILFMYALVAMVVCLFVGFSDKVLRWLVLGCAVLAVLTAVGLTVAGLLIPSLPQDANAGLGITVAEETRIFAVGSYLEQLAFRAMTFPLMAGGIIAFLPFLGGLFLLGVLLARHGVLQDPKKHPRARNVMLFVGLAVALPINLLYVPLMSSKTAILYSHAIEMGIAPFVSVGLAMLLAVWGSSRLLSWVQKAISKVGRTAFSCYILQSILCTLIFYSWGFGLFGQLDRLQMLAVVGVVWIADLLFAHFWLKAFDMGPLEWLWRSWTEGRRLKI